MCSLQVKIMFWLILLNFAVSFAQQIHLKDVPVLNATDYPALAKTHSFRPIHDSPTISIPLHELQPKFTHNFTRSFFDPIFGKFQAKAKTWTQFHFPTGKYFDNPSGYAHECQCNREIQNVTLTKGTHDIRVRSLSRTWLVFRAPNATLTRLNVTHNLTNSYNLLSLFLTNLFEKYERLKVNIHFKYDWVKYDQLSASFLEAGKVFPRAAWDEVLRLQHIVFQREKECTDIGCSGALIVSIPVGRQSLMKNPQDAVSIIPQNISVIKIPDINIIKNLNCDDVDMMTEGIFWKLQQSRFPSNTTGLRMIAIISLFNPRMSHFSKNELIVRLPSIDRDSFALFFFVYPMEWFPNNTIFAIDNSVAEPLWNPSSIFDWCHRSHHTFPSHTRPFYQRLPRLPPQVHQFYRTYPVNLVGNVDCEARASKPACTKATGSTEVAMIHGIPLAPFHNVSYIPVAPVNFQPTRFRQERFFFFSLIGCLFSEAVIHFEMKKLEDELETRLNRLQVEIDGKFRRTAMQMKELGTLITQSTYALEDVRDSEAAIARDLHRFEYMQLAENQHLLREIQRNRMLILQNQRNALEDTRASLSTSLAQSHAIQACWKSLSTLEKLRTDNSSLYSLAIIRGQLRLKRLATFEARHINSTNSSIANIKDDLDDLNNKSDVILHQLDHDILVIDNISINTDVTLPPLVFTEDAALFNFSDNDFFGDVGAGINSLEGVVVHGLDDVKDVINNSVDDVTGILGQPLLMLAVIGGSAVGAVLLIMGSCYAWKRFRVHKDNAKYQRGVPRF